MLDVAGHLHNHVGAFKLFLADSALKSCLDALIIIDISIDWIRHIVRFWVVHASVIEKWINFCLLGVRICAWLRRSIWHISSLSSWNSEIVLVLVATCDFKCTWTLPYGHIFKVKALSLTCWAHAVIAWASERVKIAFHMTISNLVNSIKSNSFKGLFIKLFKGKSSFYCFS